MKVKSVVLLFALIAAAALPAKLVAQTKIHHVVFALTSGDEADWKLTLGNIHNLLIGTSPTGAEIEVVVYGPGLSFVKKGSSADQEISALEAQHVRFVACENSMRMQHVLPADLVAGVGTVPSGIVEVITRQEQGWSYIKAGR